MSTTVDSRVVEMQFNNSQFESNVKTSMSTLEKLKESLNFSGLTSSFDNITSSASKVDMSTLSSAVETVGSKFSALEVIAITALANITNSAISAGEQLISSLTVDQISAGWEKFAENTKNIGTLISQGFELDEVEEQMARLLWYTDETSYNYTDMVSNIAKFTASGQSLTDSVTAMEGIANMAALSGQNATTASQAMYQLSQAMSYGYMRLADWQQAISNKNMDTVEFRQQCLDAAVALGTLTEELDGTYTVISTGANFTLSSITSELTDGAWLTSDVMMQVFSNYASVIDEIYEYSEEKGITASEAIAELGDTLDEFGLTAFKAAQEARSWSDVIDSVKDAVSTGWMNTFTYIFGDYEEATALWTDLANALYDVFMTGINDRNEVLEAWSDLGGREVLLEAFWAAWENIAEICGTVKEAFSEVFPSKTAEELYAITEAILALAEKFKMSEENLANLKSTFKGLFSILSIGWQAVKAIASGFATLLSGSSSLASSLLSVTGAAGEWITRLDEAIKESDIFNVIVQEIVRYVQDAAQEVLEFAQAAKEWLGLPDLNTIVESVLSFISAVRESEFAGTVFQIFSDSIEIAAQLASAFAEAVKEWFSLNDLSSVISTVSDAVGDFTDRVKENEVISKVTEYVKEAVDSLTSFASKLKENFETSGLSALKSVFETIAEKIGEAVSAIFGFKDSVNTTFDEIGDKLSNCTFIKVLSTLWAGITAVASAVADILGTAVGGLIKTVGNADLTSFLEVLNQLITGGILISIVRLLNDFATGIGSVTSFMKDLKKNAVEILEDVGEALEAWTLSIKADALLKIAAAVGILALALIALTGVDSEQMTAAIGAITMLLTDLVVAMAALQKLSGASSDSITGSITGLIDSFSNTKQYSNMIKMAAAIAILAAVVAILGSVDSERLNEAIGAITILFAELVAATAILDQLKGKTSVTTMIGLAAAILILSSSVTSLAGLDWEGIAQGLTAVTVLCADMVASMIALNKLGGSTSGMITMIALAAAIKILASACADFGEMSWSEIAKGLTSVTVLLAELTAFSALNSNASGMISTGLALIEIAAAMKIFASAVGDFGELSWEEIAKGLTSMAVVLAEVAVAANLLPSNMVSKAAGLVIMGAALEIIADVLGDLGGMSWGEIAKGLLAMGVALAELAVALNLMSGTLSGSAALLVAAVAIDILVPGLKSLGSMSLVDIATALIALAGAFAVIGAAAAILSPFTVTILALSAAFALIGVGVAAVGVGLVAAAAGITALATALTVGVVAIVTAIETILLAIINLIPDILIAIGEGIIGICDVIAASASSIGEAVKAIVLTVIDILVECIPAIVKGAYELILGVMDGITTYAPQIIASLVQMITSILNALADNIPEFLVAVMNFIGSLFSAIVDAINNIDTSALVDGIVCVGLLSALVLALSAIAGLIPLAMVALAALGVMVAEMAAIFAAIGLMAQLPGLTWLIDEGAELLGSIGNAIGSFVGGVVGGFASGISSQFAQIGSDLSDFMENAQPFIEGASNIDSSLLTGVTSLVGAVLMLTAADILTNLTSWLTGGSSLVQFGQELAEFGPYFAEYYESIKDIKSDVVESSANAASAIAEMATKVPNSGGLVSKITGENSLAAFAEELVEFGPALKKYADSVDGLDADVVTNSTYAASAISELASNLPNSGGLVSKITGDNSLAEFAAELAEFGPALMDYAESVDGLDADIVVESANAAMAIAELATNLPNTGGLLSKFTGDNSLAEFACQLAEFGPLLKKYAESVSGLDSDIIIDSINAATAVSEFADNLPNQGGLTSIINGDNTLSKFGKELAKFGPYLKEYADSVAGLDEQVVSNSVSASKALFNLVDNLPEKDILGNWTSGNITLTSFASELTTFGKKLSQYAQSVAGLDSDIVIVSALAANALFEMADNLPEPDGIIDWLTGGTTLTQFAAELENFGPKLKDYADSVAGLDKDIVENSANAAIALFEMSDHLPDKGVISDWSSGSFTLSQFATELAAFGPELKAYSDSVYGLDTDIVTSSTYAAKALFEMAENLPQQGGISSWFSGSTSLSEFAEELKIFGPKLKSYADSIEGLDTDLVINSANAAMALAEFANNLPDTTGLLSKITGSNSISKFSEELVAFGPNLKAYADSIDGLNPEVVLNSAYAAKALAELANELPTTGGIFSFFTGSNDFETFGKNLVAFGKQFKLYSDSVQGVDPDVVLATTNVATSLVELANGLPESGGWFSNTTTLSDFGSDLAAFGSYLSSYYSYTSGIDTTKLSKVIQEVTKLIDMAKDMMGIDTSAVKNFGSALKELGKTGVDEFISAFEDATSKVEATAKAMLETFVNGANSQKSTLQTTFTNLAQAALDKLTDKKTTFNTVGSGLISQLIAGISSQSDSFTSTITQLIESGLSYLTGTQNNFQTSGQSIASNLNTGLNSGVSTVLNTVTTMLSDMITAIKNKYTEFYNSGYYLVQGFSSGISSSSYIAALAAQSMANSAISAAKTTLSIASPSKIFYGLGAYSGEGFTNALYDYANVAYRAASNMASSATKGLGDAVSKITDAIQGEIDTEITVRPVLDLTDVQDGTKRLANMMSQTKAYSVSGSFNMAAQTQKSIDNSSKSTDAISESINELKQAVKELTDNPIQRFENVFNITEADDANDIASKVSRIIQQQVERKNARWA